jgi:hypothetical protein
MRFIDLLAIFAVSGLSGFFVSILCTEKPPNITLGIITTICFFVLGFGMLAYLNSPNKKGNADG